MDTNRGLPKRTFTSKRAAPRKTDELVHEAFLTLHLGHGHQKSQDS